MRDQITSKKSNKEKSFSDLNRMEDNESLPSASNLQSMGQSYKESSSMKNQNSFSKLGKKKSLVKESKGNSSNLNPSGKRVQSKGASLPYSKIYNKKSSEFRQSKFEQFQAIYKAFSMFPNQFINFNEVILALKSLGVQIQTDRKFQAIKNIYDELTGKMEAGIDFEAFGKLAIKLLKQEKAKSSSELSHLEKGYYYMIQEANQVKMQSDSEDIDSTKNLFPTFKSYVEQLGPSKKYLTQDTFTKLTQYLGMEKQLTQNDINNILTFADKQAKGYMSFQDVIRAIQTTRMVQF